MLRAVIQMPYDMVMDNELSRRQFYDRAQQALAERDAFQEQVRGWIAENNPGGWIDQVRRERAAWRERFPQYIYRPQDDCIERKGES
jgi:hypothetical protein